MTSFPTAPIWRRLAALVYDLFILLAISFAYGALLTAISAAEGNAPEDYQPMFDGALFFSGWLACLLAFYLWFWHKSGQTIGMRTWRLKLIASEGEQPQVTWGQCIKRGLITPLLLGLGGVAYWYQFFDNQGDCLHDKISGTRVVVVPKGH